MKIQIKKLFTFASTPAKVPQYETRGASGFDLRASIDRSIELPPGGRVTIPTGLAFAVPEGFELQIRPRSGLAFKHGVMTSFGTVDSDYRGEVKLNMMNLSRTNYTIQAGERLAQGVIAPVLRVEFEMVEDLPISERGGQGFGSTGSK